MTPLKLRTYAKLNVPNFVFAGVVFTIGYVVLRYGFGVTEEDLEPTTMFLK